MTEDHIHLCAEEVELTAPQVRERLAHCGPLFHLTLPPHEESV
ncbi:hypothetical protein [Streptomyces sp. NPDC051921]